VFIFEFFNGKGNNFIFENTIFQQFFYANDIKTEKNSPALSQMQGSIKEHGAVRVPGKII